MECDDDNSTITGSSPHFDYIFATLNLIIGLSSIIMNFLVFSVYLKMNWKHPTYFLFINITLHDAVSGFTGIYMAVFLFFGRTSCISMAIFMICKVMGFLWSLTAFTTPTLLCFASIYRFMAIYMPYSYRDIVNIRTAAIGVTLGWIIGAISTVVPLISGQHYTYQKEESVCDVAIEDVNDVAMIVFILIPLLAPLCVLMLCNAAVLLHLCKCTGRNPSKSSEHQEQPLNSNQASTTFSSSTNKPPQFGPVCEWKHKVAKKDYHTAVTVVLMTLNYIFCYGLWIVYFINRVLAKNVNRRFFSDNPSKEYIIYIDATIKVLAVFNSALNGIVHIVRGSHLRTHIRNMLGCCLTCDLPLFHGTRNTDMVPPSNIISHNTGPSSRS